MEPRETSGATTSLIVRYVRRAGGEDAVRALVERAGVEQSAAELEDEARWVSYDTRIRLLEAAVDVLDDPETPFRIGTTALEHALNHALVLMVRTLGSPRQVYRGVAALIPKFSSTSTMRVLESGPDHAVLSFTLHDGYEHSRLDCAYAQGLLSVVPKVFGLPAARIVHDECESDGHPTCVYHVTWSRRRRMRWLPGRRTSSQDAELRALRGQLEALQSAASDLVDSDGVDQILQRITERAAAAVLAPAYLLAVTDRTGGPPLVHHAGLDPQQVPALAEQLLTTGRLPDAVVVDVQSARRSHGRLAAVYGSRRAHVAVERSLLGSYARHAAAALDLIEALEDSRSDERRARAVLSLAHQLASAGDAQTVAHVVCSALPDVVGSDSNSFMLWDPAQGVMQPIASEGHSDERREFLLGYQVPVHSTPELAALLGRRDPMVLALGSVSEPLHRLMAALGLQNVVVVPLVAGDALLGVTTTSYRNGLPANVDDVLARLQGVGDQAATALRNAQLLQTVRHQSLHDSLTGLPNRRLFTQRMDDALRATGERDAVALLFCDLDRFKQVNDSHGHHAGDELLRQIAARLLGTLRPSDTVARISGDEFAVLLPSVPDADVATELAHRVVACFEPPFRLEGRDVRVTTSVGIAVHHGPDGRGDLLLRAADAAMYDAKQRGRNQIAVSGQRTATELGGGSLEAELEHAIAAGELVLFFQPVVQVARASGLPVVGAEALVRWQHPRLGLLGPAAFLPLAEESGLVVDLDLWALGAACSALSGWGPRGGPMHVAVNLAAPTLLDPRLPEAVRSALAVHGVDPQRLHLEVVESRSLSNLPGVVERLVELRQIGVRVSLDDFGTGYSTLAWLQQLPVDQIKIDRSFIAALPDHAPSMAVVRGVVELARGLGVEVVAEGVEDERQLAALRDAGCDLAQGYLLGRPGPQSPVVSPQPVELVAQATGSQDPHPGG
ncbi:putative bifunctional diguanylate cyclase/phosphodiesterase [Thalassiella azotivora]